MKFYRLGDIPIRNNDRVFKASATGPFIWFVVFSSLGVALLLLGICGTKMYGLRPPAVFFSYVGAMALGLFGWLALGQFRASVKPTNWLLRCNDSGVIIKYRSFQNWRFPTEAVQAVGFDYSEMAEVSQVKEQRFTPALDAGRTAQRQRLTYLRFYLASADASDLEAHLQAERQVEPPGRFVKTTIRDYPVEVLPGGIVQLRWSISGGYKVTPSISKAIEYLARHVKVANAQSVKVDLSYQSNLSPEEGDAKIRELAKSGDKLGAVKLARQIYGSNLSEAMAFVEKLQSGG